MWYLIRFGGEIATKSRATRRRFQAQLARNLRAAMRGEGIVGGVEVSWSRLYVNSEDPRVADILGRVFGVQSFSPVEARKVARLEDVVAAGEAIFREEVAGVRFAVRARVTGGPKERAEYGTRDLERVLGAALLPYSAGVDLSHPDVTASVEVRDDTAYFFTLVLPGPGGLPLGVQDGAVALVSGGFDSAVAAWMVQRRGVPVDYVLCELGGESHRAEARAVIDVLTDHWSYGARPRLHVIDFSAVALEIERAVRPRFRQLVLKRQMLRAADAVADRAHADAIVTGDAIGQVASQTVRNLRAMSGAAKRPILRPLLGMDKLDIIRWAETIGTASLSAGLEEHCALVQRNPATAADLAVVVEEEARVDASILATAIAQREVVSLRGGAVSGRARTPVTVDALPAGVRVVDLRSRAAYEAWHVPGAEHLAYESAVHQLDAFGPGATVVLYCAFGAKSAILAQALRRKGVDAWSFAGGSRALAGALGAAEPDPRLAHVLLGFAEDD